jgi:hypothetical protein
LNEDTSDRGRSTQYSCTRFDPELSRIPLVETGGTDHRKN